MTNEQQKPTTPATNPASPQHSQGDQSPQQNPKPGNDQPGTPAQQK